MTQFAPPVRTQARGANPHEALRHHVVTAVLVSHDGSRWLAPVLEALLGQQRPVQRIVAVDTGSHDDSADLLEAALGPDRVLRRKRSSGYGAAIAFGLNSLPPVGYDEFGYDSPNAPVEWIWLLHDDSAPAPDALGQLLLAAEDEPDAAVIGPKIRGWYDKRQLLEVGATVAANGRRWTGLERNEHDQGQHDEVRPVLSVSSAGMLVRRDVWDRLRGFDRGISLFRDDLDFCWRVNSAGYKVLVAPDAVVHHAEAAARERRKISAGPNRPHLLDRGHALYTVAVNRPARFWPLLYLRLIVGSVFRALGFVIAKSPGIASDELFAVIGFALRPDRVLRGRASRRKIRQIDPAELEQYFPPRGALARAAFDNISTQLRGSHDEGVQESSRHRSVETGPVSEEAEVLETDSGALIKRLIRRPIIAVGLGLTLISLFAARSIMFGGSLAGGALLPAPAGASDLWAFYTSGWHGVGLGTTADAPPYLAVVATLASVLFGKPDWAVSVLLIGSVPLAGLSASYAFRRVTEAGSLRIWGGYAYALLAVATGAIASGRLGTAVAVAVLPLVVTTAGAAIGGPGRTGSTRSAWTCAFLLSLAAAFAPVTWLIALVFGALAVLTVAWRTRANVVVVVIRMAIILGTPLAVLAPWSFSLLRHPSAFLIEAGATGINLGQPKPTPIGLLLGDPGGPGTYPSWVGAGLLLAALAALLRGTRRRVVLSAWALAVVGFGAAVFLAGQRVVPPGANQAVVPWPGVPTAMLGFGLITATVVGAEGLRERMASAAFGWRQPLAVLVTGAAVLAPVAAGAWWVARGAQGPLSRVDGQILPAYVSAENEIAARTRALMLSVGVGGEIDYSVVRDSGPTLGDADVRPSAGQTAQLDGLVGQLLSGNAGTAAQQLATLDIGYVLVSGPDSTTLARLLDGVPGLTERSLSLADSGPQFDIWAVNASVGRLSVLNPGGAAAAVDYSCSAAATASTASVCSQDETATVAVPAGATGRTLVLAEAAEGGWTASMDGRQLSVVTQPNGLQAWALPADAGTVTIGYHSYRHTALLLFEGLAAFAATVMALPFGRRPDEDIEGEEAAELGLDVGDAAEEPENAGQRRGRRGVGGTADEPEPQRPEQPEPQPEPEPAYAGDARRAAEIDEFEQVARREEAQAPEPQRPRVGFLRGQSDFAEDEGADGQEELYDSGAYESGGYEAVRPQPEQYEDEDGYEPAGPRTRADGYGDDGYRDEPYVPGTYDTGERAAADYPSGEYAAAPGHYGEAAYEGAPYEAAQQGADAYPSGEYATGHYATQEPYTPADYGAQERYSDAEGDYAASGTHPADQYAAAPHYAPEQYQTGTYDSGQYATGEPYDAHATGGYEQYPPAQDGYQQDPYASYAGDAYGQQPYAHDPYATGAYPPPGAVNPDQYPQGEAVPGQYAPEQGADPADGADYGYEYGPEGYAHGEQDGWTR